jgi:N-acetylmuramoyl-L-alanine amidase
MRRVAWFVLGPALAAVLFGGAGSAFAQRRPALTAALPTPPALTGPARIVALDARLAGDDKRTRLVFDLTRKLDLRAFVLSDPYRVIVDLPEVMFDLPAAAGREGRGLVSAFRYGLFAPGKTRIVIDAKGPVAIDKAYVLAEQDDQPARLVIDLVKSDRESFIKTAALQRNAGIVASIPVDPRTLRDVPAPRDGKPVIVIDPGHGGLDTGAVSTGGEEEKALVLAVALKLRDRLEKSGRYRVVLTRSDDTFIPLGERVAIARAHKAALFISIHADSISRKEGDVRGATVYTVSERASDAEAARLAETENRADLIAGIDLKDATDDVAEILFELAHRETKNFSAHFARTLVGQIKAAARLHPQPLKSAGFKVLKAPDIPSVLLELGYLSSKEDAKLLASDAWRDKVSESMGAAIDSFFATKVAGTTPAR